MLLIQHIVKGFILLLRKQIVKFRKCIQGKSNL